MHSLSTAFVTFYAFNSYKKHVAWMCASFLLSWREDDFSRGNEWGTLFLLVYRNHFFLRFSSIVRVTWSHALALDCIRDILCIQFVQKTRGVDVCVFPSKDATSGSSRKHTTNDGWMLFLLVYRNHFFLRFSSPSPKLQSRVVPSSKDAEFNAACSLFMYTTYEKTSRFIKGTWISTNKNNFIHG